MFGVIVENANTLLKRKNEVKCHDVIKAK